MKTADPVLGDISPGTLSLLGRMRSYKAWFSEAGKPLARNDLKSVVLFSWKEATKAYDSDDWVNLGVDMANLLAQSEVTFYDPKWGAKVRAKELPKRDEIYKSLFKESFQLAMKQLGMFTDTKEKGLDISIQGDWLACVRASEVAGVFPNAFYSKLIEIYLAGHLPCGFKGVDVDTGTFIIY